MQRNCMINQTVVCIVVTKYVTKPLHTRASSNVYVPGFKLIYGFTLTSVPPRGLKVPTVTRSFRHKKDKHGQIANRSSCHLVGATFPTPRVPRGLSPNCPQVIREEDGFGADS